VNNWGPHGNRVASSPPGHGDVFCVTTLLGKRVFLETIADYAAALDRANRFIAVTKHTSPLTVRVMCLSLVEAQAMGFVPDNLVQDQTPAEQAADRELVVTTLMDVLRKSNEAAPRAEAIQLLRAMKELP
jgi:hypothetical protein